MNDSKVLATVNGKEITESDLNLLLESLGPQRAMQFQSEEGKKRLVEELINQELFYLDALKHEVDKEEGFKREIEQAKANLLKQYAIRTLLGEATVTEEETQNYYNENKDQFKEPEQAKASHILIEDKDEAVKIVDEIKNGLSFEEAAKKYSKCPSNTKGGDLGYFKRGQMVPEFENAVFNMETGTISDPVKTQFGYHIIKLVDKKEAQEQSFEEAKNQIGQMILGKKQNELYLGKTSELRKEYDIKINE